MGKYIILFTLISLELFGKSNIYCVDQYNKTQQTYHKVVANLNAKRQFYAKVEANVFQDYIIDLRLNCSKTKNKTIKHFLKDSHKMEDLMVALELLKHVSYK